MPVTATGVDLVIIKVPLALPVSGTPTSIVLEPAMTTFVTAANAYALDPIAVQELHSQDWTIIWSRMEFVALASNASALETLVNTLQTSLNTQNPGVTVAVSAWAITSGAFRLVFS